MKHKKKKSKRLLTLRTSAAYFLTAALSASLLLTGCSPSAMVAGITDAAGQAIAEAASLLPESRQPAKNPESDRQFDQITDQITEELLCSSLLDQHLLVSDPNALGYRRPDSLYGEISLESMQKSTKDCRRYLETLKALPKAELSTDRQLTYEILEDYLSTALESEGLEFYYQPLSPTTGLQTQLPILLAEMNFYSRADIEDYFSLISGLGDYFDQILSWEQSVADQGLMMTDPILDEVIDSCEPYLGSADSSVLSGTFMERLNSMSAPLTQEEKEGLVRQHDQLIEEAFAPAYQKLREGLTALKGTGRTEGGLCSYPDGKEYYAYLVKSVTSTSCKDPESLEKVIEKRMNRDLRRIAELLSKNPELSAQLAAPSYCLSDPEEILKHLQAETKESFPEPIQQEFTLRRVPSALESVLSPAFYLIPPLDNRSNQIIYINEGSKTIKDSLFSTLGHEGFPGHLYQNAYFFSQDPNPIRRVLSYPAYSEGWGTYAEFYSYHMNSGLSEPLAEYLEITSSISLGIHAYLDLMVHNEGWGTAEIAKYLGRYFTSLDPATAQSMYDTLLGTPANYLEYYTGYLEFTDMKEQAKDALGSQYDEKRFHQFLLDLGPAPFQVIRIHLKSWIREEKKQGKR